MRVRRRGEQRVALAGRHRQQVCDPPGERGGVARRRALARAQPPLVKVIDGAIDRDLCQRVKAASPRTMIVGRIVWNPQTIGAYGDFQNRVLSAAAQHRGLLVR